MRIRHFTAVFAAALVGFSPTLPAQPPTQLRVALYPYVPDARGLFFELEREFEARHPGVNLELVETSTLPGATGPTPLADTYYSGGLVAAQADVYEIDVVLLDAMRRAGKIAPIRLPQRSFLPVSVAAVTADGHAWAVPHWICGNFLFYRRGDSAIETAATWEQLVGVVSPGQDVLVDLVGRSTLGEWYLLSLATGGADAATLLRRVQSDALDPAAVGRVQRLLDACPAGFCRSGSLHDQTGSYARLFAEGRARAYIGYSETLYHALHQTANGCQPHERCLTEEQIAVRALPPAAAEGTQVGWVDGLAIAAGLSPAQERLAREFIDMATSWESYRLVLNPEWPAPPRYLLPAVLPAAGDPALEPGLYPDLYRAFGSRLILTGDGLNDALRARGASLHCALTPERNDEDWKSRCRP